MENQINLQNQNLSCKSIYYELPKLLGIIGSGVLLLWALPEILLYSSEGIFFGTLIILPAFLGLIGAIKVKNRPIMSGFLMFIGGWIYLVFPLTITLNPILLFSGLFLLLGGVLTMKHTKEILAMNGKDLPKYYRKIKILAKILTIIFCFLLFLILLIPDYTPRDKAINAKSKSDLSQIMLGVEMYYADNSIYPKQAGNGLYCGDPGVIADESGVICSGFPFFDGGAIYIKCLPKIPEDAKVKNHNYTYTGDTKNYGIEAELVKAGKYGLIEIGKYICENGFCYEEQKKE